MIKKYIAFVLLSCIAFATNAQQAVYKLPAFKAEDCEPNTLNIKVKEEFRNLCTPAGINHQGLADYLAALGTTGVAKVFPNAKQPDKNLYAQAEKPADITLIYRLTYSANVPLLKVVNALTSFGLFVYVEPNFIQQKCYTTNDPLNTNQWYIGQLKANLAWDITKGDTNMVIGITDSGVDTNHLDLKPNIKFNWLDPRNGIDDDGDGYIDNYRGWNMWANNDNVYDAQDSHGTFVAGISSAKTDNSFGISGLGFKCKFLPVRLDDNHGSYIRAYEAVVYAADHGCKVINCSWGSHYACNFGYDVITYAAINKDAVIVASAGNDNTAQPFFPASFQYVLNVGGLQQSNAKANSSSWGANVDLMAYGSSVYSTYNPNYTTSGGTSASAPMVSAAAALVRVYNPTWNALKVAEQVKVTADASIYNLPANSAYANKFGRGLLDMQKALADTSSPSIVMLNKRIVDNNDNNFIPGDTLRLSGVFKNYIRPATAITVTLSCTSPNVTILNNTFILGNLNQNDTVSNRTNPFKVVVLNNTPVYTPLEFKFTIAGGGYTGLEWMLDTVNRDFVNIDVGNVIMSVHSKGNIGFNNQSFTGYGFTYKDSGPLFSNSGLLVGSAAGSGTRKVMDNVVTTIPTFDTNWASTQTVKKRSQSVVSAKDVYGKFDDSPAGSGRIGVTVEHRGFGWAGLSEKFVILEYSIRSTGQNIDSLVAGIFADWEILNYTTNNGTVYVNNNIINTDATRKLIYGYNIAPQSIYAGVRLLSTQNANYYAFNGNGAGGSVNLDNGFTTDEKYNTMSGLQTRLTSTTGDGAATLGVGPVNLAAGDSFKFAVAFVAGDNLADLQVQSDSAYARYWRYIWTGYESTDWNTGGNWSWYRIPTDTNNVLIPANPVNLPNVGNYDGFSKNLMVLSPSTISQTGANSQLKVKGNLFATGTGGINATQGTIVFNGITPQTIDGVNSVNGMFVLNPAGVKNNTNATLTIKGPLTIQQGDLINKGTLNKE